MRVNIGELAEILGVSRPTVTAWTNDGMPAAAIGSKGKPWEYLTEECIAWWAENKFRTKQRGPAPGSDPFAEGGERESYEEAERREKIAKADKAELELAKLAQLVVPIEVVSGAVMEEHVRVRSRLLSVGNEVRLRVRTFLENDRKAEEAIVAAVEVVISEAMAEIRGEGEESLDESD